MTQTNHENWDYGNKSVPWDKFDGDAYQKHYFGGRVEAEDEWAMLTLAQFLVDHADIDGLEQAVDVGTATSLVLPLAIVPYVMHLDLLDPGRQNVTNLRSVLSDRERLERDWGPTIQRLQEFNPEVYGNVIDKLMERAEVHQCYAQDFLKAQQYDALTMGFCAGSNSESPDETAIFMGIVLGSVKLGAIYAATHTLNSGPYPDWSTKEGAVDMQKFPSPNVDQPWYGQQYAGTGVELRRSPMTEMRPGYEGTLLALGIITAGQENG